MEKQCDILIVGAGPAGLTAASLLSKKGFNITIIEKNQSIGYKQKKLDIIEGNRVEKILKNLKVKPNRILSLSEWIANKNSYLLDSEIKDYYFIRGNEPDSLEYKLLNTIDKENVKFLFNSQIDKIELNDSKIAHIQTNGTRIKAKKIICATGKGLKIEQKMGIASEINAKINGLGIIFDSEKKSLPHTKVFFDEKIAPGGYIYAGTTNQKTYVCTVTDNVFIKNVNLKKNIKHFVNNQFGKIQIEDYFSGFGISGIKQTIKGNTYFIGGSAFFHDPFLGYGLNYAIESGYFVAQTIIEENQNIFRTYTDQIHKEMKDLLFARKILRKADSDFFNEFIKTLNGNSSTSNNEITKLAKLLEN